VREGRERVLAVYGPVANPSTPSAPGTVAFVRTLLDGSRGAYRHLGHVLSPLTRGRFKLEVREVRAQPPTMGARARRTAQDSTLPVFTNDGYRISATYVSHGNYPALAWRIEVANHRLVFAGDASGDGGTLERLAENADLLVAHNAVPEGASAAERAVHMPPSVIGRIADAANAKRLILSHRTHQTAGQETVTLAAIGTHYAGPVSFADDLSCYTAP
jgi:ribonuclease BN (tRNA processing enzyme)